MIVSANAKKLKNNLENMINTDNKNYFYSTRKKQPKIEMLLAIKSIILTLLFNLKSVSDILVYLNNADSKFSVSDTTLMKFLNEYAQDEYILTQKVRYFYYKINRIEELRKSTSDYKEIFRKLNLSGKINAYTTLVLTVEDFEFFWNNYYLKELKSEGVESYEELNHKRHSQHKNPLEIIDEIYKSKQQNRAQKEIIDIDTDTDKKEVKESIVEKKTKEPVTAHQNIILDEDAEDEPAINELGILEKIYPRDAQFNGYKLDLNASYSLTHKNAKSEFSKNLRKLIEKPLKDIPYKFEILDTYRFKNTYKPITFIGMRDEAIEEREIKLDLMRPLASIDDVDEVDFKNYKEQIIIHQDYECAGTPLTNMTGFRLDYETEKPLEKFIYLDNIEFIHFIDLTSLNFVEGQAIVTNRDEERRGGAGFDLFRYYKGEIYFVSKFDTLLDYSPSIVDYIQSNFAFSATQKLKDLEWNYMKYNIELFKAGIKR